MATKELCKMRYDGSHYLASPYVNDSDYTIDQILNTPKEKLGLKEKQKKSDFFYNEFARLNYGIPSKSKRTNLKFFSDERNQLTDFLNKYYLKLKVKDLTKKELRFLVWASAVKNDYIRRKFFIDEDSMWFFKFVSDFMNRKFANDLNRSLRFKRKAYNNSWNYFVTFTYNDALCDEEEFVRRLKTKLQNLHSKKGWNYMCVFERGKKTNRLHVHGLVFVPDSAMVGTIRTEKSWDNDNHKIIDVEINEEFEKKIGRNDFKLINTNDGTFDNALDYILKYMSKTNDRIFYSRGLKEESIGIIPFDDHMICNYNKCSSYFVMDEKFITKFEFLEKSVLN